MAQKIQSGTTTGGAVTTVTLLYRSSIEIINRGAVDMWVRADGVDPTIAGDECFYVAPQSFISVTNPNSPPSPPTGITSNSEIRMLTASNCAYTVSVGV